MRSIQIRQFCMFTCLDSENLYFLEETMSSK